MRTITTTTNVFTFDELSEEAKQKAIEELAYINVEFQEWWESTYDDAENVGIKITGFDIDRGAYCNGCFQMPGKDVAELILENHGESCETHKTAQSYLDDIGTLRIEAENKYKEYLESIEEDEESEYNDFEEFFEDRFYGQMEDLEEEFKKSILEDYRILLQKDYEYLTGEEAIIESIEANKYEFAEDGERI